MTVVRPLTAADLAVVPAAFTRAGWPGKPAEQYARYLREQTAGTRDVLVAILDGTFAGYLTVRWTSPYPPFRDTGTPEIQDLNVLPQHRRRGVGTALMDAAETRISARSDVAGIGVGLYAAYGAAHRLYARRGYVPDGRGVVGAGGVPVEPGATVAVDDDLVLMMTRRLR